MNDLSAMMNNEYTMGLIVDTNYSLFNIVKWLPMFHALKMNGVVGDWAEL